MKKLLVVVSLAALLSCGVECFRMSDKDYENIDRMLDFGAQVFLSYLDKVREVTERMVRNNQLRTNRIAIQGYWNSFKKTANKISVEERGKGVQDDLLITVRTIRRLVLHYKDDVQNTVHLLATEKSLQQYLPTVDMFQGIIEREKLNEIWGSMESYYFPEAPSMNNSPLEFLCYLLSTTTIETFLVNVFKTGMEVISQIRTINFEEVRDSLQSTWNEISRKATEFKALEIEKGNDDDFLLAASVAARVFVFCREAFLNYTETPEFIEKFEESEKVLQSEKFSAVYYEMETMLTPLFQSDLIFEVMSLHFDYFEAIYKAIFTVYSKLLDFAIRGRVWQSTRALSKVILLVVAHTYEKLDQLDVFPMIKTLHSRASDIAYIFKEDFETFRGLIIDHWEPFREEARRVLKEKKSNPDGSLCPGVRATAQLWSNYSNQLINSIGGNIDDDEAENVLKNLEKVRATCITKLLASGIVTQEELEESQRIFAEGLLELWEKLTLKDANEVNDSLWAFCKVTLAFLNFIYSPLTHTWNFISV